jgi:putative oxidoreductase
LELITAILILNSKSIWLGSLLSTVIISGAILMHLTKLGIEINNDGGILLYTALIILMLSIEVLFKTRKHIPIIGGKL